MDEDTIPMKLVALFLVEAIEEIAMSKGTVAAPPETRAELERVAARRPIEREDDPEAATTLVELTCQIAAVLLLRMREQISLLGLDSSTADAAVIASLNAMRVEFGSEPKDYA